MPGWVNSEPTYVEHDAHIGHTAWSGARSLQTACQSTSSAALSSLSSRGANAPLHAIVVHVSCAPTSRRSACSTSSAMPHFSSTTRTPPSPPVVGLPRMPSLRCAQLLHAASLTASLRRVHVLARRASSPGVTLSAGGGGRVASASAMASAPGMAGMQGVRKSIPLLPVKRLRLVHTALEQDRVHRVAWQQGACVVGLFREVSPSEPSRARSPAPLRVSRTEELRHDRAASL